MELHRAALGDLPGLAEIGLRAFGIALHETQPGAREEAAGEVVLSITKALDRGSEWLTG
ncbi:MAG: hypothetical protein ACREUE_05000 [Panacagrimonas sp.]